MSLTVYVNDLALETIRDRRGEMPVGAMVIKDNFTADGALDSTTLMYKTTGSVVDAVTAGDSEWFWLKWRPDGSVDAAGDVDTCSQCHQMAAQNDSLMTGSIEPVPDP